MNTEKRIEALENAITTMEEKRKIMMFDLFALRSAYIGFIAAISDVSADQRAVAKSLAQDRMASFLLIAGFPGDQSEEAQAALEDLFYEIDAVRNAEGLPPSGLS